MIALLAHWRRVRRLRGAEWLDLARAQGMLLRAHLLVSTRPVGRLVSAPASSDGWGGTRSGAGRDAAADLAAAEQLATDVRRVAEHGVMRAECLVRAVALNRLLESRGLHDSRICVGVRRLEGSFQAHAWVEYAGTPLGGQLEHVTSFARVTEVELSDSV
ncbi:MAG: lasso peptide biosynthesis B2 protein [Gemmatimonadaceae bacterium]